MQKDKVKYQELLNSEWNMFSGHNDGLITFNEYLGFNKVASAIEEIFANKYSEDTVREWREDNVQNDKDDICAYSGLPSPLSYANEEIEVPCSADLDLQMYNESI